MQSRECDEQIKQRNFLSEKSGTCKNNKHIRNVPTSPEPLIKEMRLPSFC
jgi:hypothetical protein